MYIHSNMHNVYLIENCLYVHLALLLKARLAINDTFTKQILVKNMKIRCSHYLQYNYNYYCNLVTIIIYLVYYY